ncbi:MAG: hypothetical protein N2110_01455 [Flavobacteriales bacterium]|nr:hypothetical protein [Flavobacteriales bacterium]
MGDLVGLSASELRLALLPATPSFQKLVHPRFGEGSPVALTKIIFTSFALVLFLSEKTSGANSYSDSDANFVL